MNIEQLEEAYKGLTETEMNCIRKLKTTDNTEKSRGFLAGIICAKAILAHHFPELENLQKL